MHSPTETENYAKHKDWAHFLCILCTGIQMAEPKANIVFMNARLRLYSNSHPGHSNCCIITAVNDYFSLLSLRASLGHDLWSFNDYSCTKPCLLLSLLPLQSLIPFHSQPCWNHTRLLFLRPREALYSGDEERPPHLGHAAAHGLGTKISRADRKCGCSFHIKQPHEEWCLCIVEEGARM